MEKGRADIHQSDRSGTFWHGVASIAGIQKSSQVDGNNYTISTVQKQKLHDEAYAKNLSELWLVHAGDRRKLFWDIISCLAVLYTVVEVPFSIGFLGGTDDSFTWVVIDNILVTIFGIDILISCNSSYTDMKTGLLVTDRGRIIGRYSAFWLWIDLASTVPFKQIANAIDSLGSQDKLGSIKLVRLLRLSRLAQLYKLFDGERLAGIHESQLISPQLKNMITLFLQIFLTGHIVCCFWFFITTETATGLLNPDDDSLPVLIRTWVTQFKYDSWRVFDQYVASLYWSFATLFTIGYGDIHAVNVGERVYSILIMLVGSILFGAVISKITDVLDSRNIQKNEIVAKTEEFKEYLEERSYPTHLKVQAKEAYSYYLERRSTLSEKGLLDILPRDLKIKVANLKYRKEIMNIALFNSADPAFLVQLVMHSSPYEMRAGQTIYGIDDVSEELSFLLRGCIKIHTKRGSGRPSGYITSGGYIGDFEYARKSPRIADYIASQSCTLLSVPYSVLSAAVKDYPVAGERFLLHLKQRSDLFQDEVKKHLPFVLAIPVPIKEENPMKQNRNTRLFFNADTVWVNGYLKEAEVEEAEMTANRGKEIDQRWSVQIEIKTKNNLRKTVIVEKAMKDIWKMGYIIPKGKVKLYWDAWIGVLIGYSVLTLPCQLAFDSYTADHDHYGLQTFDYAVIGFFFLDILASMNTAYFSEQYGAYVLIRRLVRNQYMSTFFIIDFLAFIPLDLIVEWVLKGQGGGDLRTLQLIKVIRLLRLVKLLKISNLSKHVGYVEDRLAFSPAIFSILYTVFKLLVAGHFLACVWWGGSANLTTVGWFSNMSEMYSDMAVEPFRVQYATALYLSITTMTSTGYGDILPNNTEERCLAIIIFIVGALVYGYVTANVSKIISNFSKNETRNNKFSNQIKEFLDCQEISGALVSEVIAHAKKILKRSSVFNEAQLLGRLPLYLRTELLLFGHREALESLGFFRFIKNDSVKLAIIGIMKSNYADTGRLLLKEGESGGELVFVVSGSAAISRKRSISRRNSLNSLNSVWRGSVGSSSIRDDLVSRGHRRLSYRSNDGSADNSNHGDDEKNEKVGRNGRKNGSFDSRSDKKNRENKNYRKGSDSPKDVYTGEEETENDEYYKKKEGEGREEKEGRGERQERERREGSEGREGRDGGTDRSIEIERNIARRRGSQTSDRENKSQHDQSNYAMKKGNDEARSHVKARRNTFSDLDSKINIFKDLNEGRDGGKGGKGGKEEGKEGPPKHPTLRESRDWSKPKIVTTQPTSRDSAFMSKPGDSSPNSRDSPSRAEGRHSQADSSLPQQVAPLSPQSTYERGTENGMKKDDGFEISDFDSSPLDTTPTNEKNGKNDDNFKENSVINATTREKHRNEGNQRPEAKRIGDRENGENGENGENEADGFSRYILELKNSRSNSSSRIRDDAAATADERDRKEKNNSRNHNDESKGGDRNTLKNSVNSSSTSINNKGTSRTSSTPTTAHTDKTSPYSDQRRASVALPPSNKSPPPTASKSPLPKGPKPPMIGALAKASSFIAQRRRSSSTISQVPESEAPEILGTLRNGDFYGNNEILHRQKYGASVIASEPCWYYTLERAAVLTLVDNNPRIALELQRGLALAIDEMEAKLMSKHHQKSRVDFFSEIKEQYKESRKDNKKFQRRRSLHSYVSGLVKNKSHRRHSSGGATTDNNHDNYFFKGGSDSNIFKDTSNKSADDYNLFNESGEFHGHSDEYEDDNSGPQDDSPGRTGGRTKGRTGVNTAAPTNNPAANPTSVVKARKRKSLSDLISGEGIEVEGKLNGHGSRMTITNSKGVKEVTNSEKLAKLEKIYELFSKDLGSPARDQLRAYQGKSFGGIGNSNDGIGQNGTSHSGHNGNSDNNGSNGDHGSNGNNGNVIYGTNSDKTMFTTLKLESPRRRMLPPIKMERKASYGQLLLQTISPKFYSNKDLNNSNKDGSDNDASYVSAIAKQKSDDNKDSYKNKNPRKSKKNLKIHVFKSSLSPEKKMKTSSPTRFKFEDKSFDRTHRSTSDLKIPTLDFHKIPHLRKNRESETQKKGLPAAAGLAGGLPSYVLPSVARALPASHPLLSKEKKRSV